VGWVLGDIFGDHGKLFLNKSMKWFALPNAFQNEHHGKLASTKLVSPTSAAATRLQTYSEPCVSTFYRPHGIP